MRSFVRGAFLTLLASRGLFACGSDTGGTAGSVPEADLPQRWAEAVCTAMTDCCNTHGFPHQIADCETSISQEVTNALGTRNPAKTTYDPVAAGRCIDAYVTVYKACGTSKIDTDDACRGVFQGKVPTGGACLQSDECAPAGAVAVTCQHGTCSGTHGALGDPCNSSCSESKSGNATVTSCSGIGAGDTARACWSSDGLVCDQTSLHCVSTPKLGEPCHDLCETGAFCDNGTCSAQKDDGPCSESDACTSASYCDFTVRRCAPKKADGTECSDDTECSLGICDGAACGPKIPVDAMTCAGTLN